MVDSSMPSRSTARPGGLHWKKCPGSASAADVSAALPIGFSVQAVALPGLLFPDLPLGDSHSDELKIGLRPSCFARFRPLNAGRWLTPREANAPKTSEDGQR